MRGIFAGISILSFGPLLLCTVLGAGELQITESTSPARKPKSFSCRGRVVRENGKPVAGAEVWIKGELDESTNSDIAATTKSDRDGRFSFQKVVIKQTPDNGSFEFEPELSAIFVKTPEGEFAWQSFYIEPEDRTEIHDLKELVVKPAPKLRRRLLAEDGKPLSRVNVHVLQLEEIHEGSVSSGSFSNSLVLADSRIAIRVATDSAGRFEVTGLPANFLATLLVETSPYSGATVVVATTTKPKDLDEHIGMTPLKLTDVLVNDFTATISKGRVLRGRVKASDTSQPVADMPVELRHQSSRFGRYLAKTDARGEFTIPEIHGERFFLTVDPPGESPYLAMQTEVKLSNPMTEVPLTLLRGTPIPGQVIDQQTGKGVAGISVAFDEDPPPAWLGAGPEPPEFKKKREKARPNYLFSKTITDARGEFKFLAADRSGVIGIFGRKTPYWLPRRLDVSHRAGPFTRRCECHAKPPVLRFELNRGLTIKGRVTGPDGKAIGGALVFECARIPSQKIEVRGNDGTPFPREYRVVELGVSSVSARAQSDANGNFTLTRVAPDTDYTYVLAVDEKRQLKGLAFVREQPINPKVRSKEFPGGTRVKYDYRKLPPKQEFVANVQMLPVASVIVALRDKSPHEPEAKLRIVNPLPTANSAEINDIAGVVSAIDAIAIETPLSLQVTVDAQRNLILTNLIAQREAEHLLRLVDPQRSPFDTKLKLRVRIPSLKPGETRRISAGNWVPIEFGPGEWLDDH